MKRPMILVLVLAMLVVACDGDDEAVELTTTTSAPASETSDDGGATTTAGPTDPASEEETESTGGEPAGEPVEGYEVIVQTAGDDGDRLWILIEPGEYTSVDLENFVIDLLDSADDPILELHVFDATAALDAARVERDARTDEEQALVDQHYLVSVTDGTKVEFQGPYTAFGGFTFGS